MDENALIEETLALLPEIGKRLHVAVARHPLAAGRSLGQLRTLAHLYHHGSCTVGDIAHAVGVAMPTASELVDRLAADGLVERGVNPADRRQVLVRLTPDAVEFGAQIHALRRSQLRAAFNRLAPEERPVFVRSLRALAETLAEEPGDLPRPIPEPKQPTVTG